MLRKLLKSASSLTLLVKAFRSAPGDLRRLKAWVHRPGLVRVYLERHEIKKLQIGSGPNSLDGWLNSDFRPNKSGQVYLDATQRFPFADATFDYVFSEHLLGEFPYVSGCAMLRECWRVLKPGGKVRIATPNLENILTLGSKDPGPSQLNYLRWASRRYLRDAPKCDAALVLNYFFRGHTLVFVYSRELLEETLGSAGFTGIQFPEPGVSSDPALAGLESHGKIVGDEINRFETMVAEAIKPAATR